MTYDFTEIPDFSVQNAIADSLYGAMTFIFERHVTIQIEDPMIVRTVAGVVHGRCHGEFSAGAALYGTLSFQYALDTKRKTCTVDSIDIELGDLGVSTIAFTTDGTLYDGLLNKHKLFIKTEATKPTRMARVAAACKRLKDISDTSAPADLRTIIDECVNEILKEIQ